MILLIDNYDSFSYNLYQLIGAVEPDIKVVRNDECTLEEIAEMKPEAIILSPGPGRPEDAGTMRWEKSYTFETGFDIGFLRTCRIPLQQPDIIPWQR